MGVKNDYFISGIWKSKENTISHYFLHINMEGGFRKGEIKSEKEIIKLLDSKTILTLIWNYETGKWVDGVEVKLIEVNGEKKIRSFKDNQETDHLDKLINMRPVMTPTSKFFI
jgi:hypothetical protein